jgi:hypothetical protein
MRHERRWALQSAERCRLGMQEVEEERQRSAGTCFKPGWGVVMKHASHGPRLRAQAPRLAAKVRRELIRFTLEAPAKDAIETLEAFDFEYPRGWAILVDEDNPYAGGPSRDNEARMAPTRAAWEFCRAAAGVTDRLELRRLRSCVRETLTGWPADLVAWYVAQVDAVSKATTERDRVVARARDAPSSPDATFTLG